MFNNQLHILINLGKYVIARPNHLWGYKNQLWSLTFSTLDYKQFTSRASNGSRLSAFVQISALFQIYITDMSRHLHHLTNCPFEVKKGGLKGLFLYWEVILLIFFVFFLLQKGTFFGRKRPLLCGGSVLLSRHELCRIYALFWSDFDADFYADIEDFVQILCRFLHKKMLVGSSVLKSWFES